MAALIPALGTCVSCMTSGERRLAERLEQKLDDAYLLRYSVSVGPKQTYPTFAVLHPRIACWCPGGKVRLGSLCSNPVRCGREGQAPVITKLPTLRDEAFVITDRLASAYKEGLPGATWPCCVRIGKPWSCAPVPWPNASFRTACARRVANTGLARMRFR